MPKGLPPYTQDTNKMWLEGVFKVFPKQRHSFGGEGYLIPHDFGNGISRLTVELRLGDLKSTSG